MATHTSIHFGDILVHKPLPHYNKLSVVSFILSLSFIIYFLVLASNVLFFHTFLQFSLVFIVCIPLLAGALAAVSLRQMRESNEHGATLSYIALSITALYITATLSIGFVLIGLYVLYTFIL